MNAPLLMFAHKGHDWIRGSEQCVLDLLSGLDRARYRLLVVANGRTFLRECERLGVESLRVAHWGGGRILDAPWRQLMRNIVRTRQPAMIHANMAVALPLVMPAAHENAIPVLSHLHTSYDSLGERHQALVRECDVIVGVAEHVVAPLKADAATRDRVRVINNAVNPEHLGDASDDDLRDTLAIPRGALVATSVGSLIARKAHEVTIRAIGLARDRGLDVHLLVCGDGDRETDLRALAESLGLGAVVHFLGARHDVGGVLAIHSDVFVTSARDEAMPLSMLEAEWAGVPVIASNIPAHRETLAEGALGILVACGDSNALANALVALARDPDRRSAMGSAGREHALAHYGMNRYVGEFDALYQEMLVGAVT